jgi:hypothetical protein
MHYVGAYDIVPSAICFVCDVSCWKKSIGRLSKISLLKRLQMVTGRMTVWICHMQRVHRRASHRRTVSRSEALVRRIVTFLGLRSDFEPRLADLMT